MPRVCYFTGKKTSHGNQVTHRGKAKYLGGVGTKITGVTRRTFRPNIQKVRALIDGRIVRLKVSAKAIRNGLIVKPAHRKYSKPAADVAAERGVPPMAEQHKITLDQVRHVAKLARVALDETKLVKLSGQLESILGYIDKISQADVTGVEPMAHALPIHNVFREDVVQPSLPLEKVLQNAPDSDGPFFKVPKVIGGDEDSAG